MRDFPGGLNAYVHPLMAPEGSLSRMENFDASTPGMMILRAGVARPSGWPGVLYGGGTELRADFATAGWGNPVRTLLPVDPRFVNPPTVAQAEG